MAAITLVEARAPAPEVNGSHMAEEWLSPAELARLLDVSRDTIYRLLAAQELPCRARRVGRQWRINLADVEEWMKGQEG